MRITVFDTRRYDRAALEEENAAHGHELTFLEPRLDADTAILAKGSSAVCSFVNDRVDAACLDLLADAGVRLVLLRSAGFNHVDLEAAERRAIKVARVPEYSPYAVAEHTFALLLALVRRIPRATARVREANFSLEGLVGFDLRGKTFGVLGTGRIGVATARIALGFGCRVLAYDLKPDPQLEDAGARYTSLAEIYDLADVVSLHVPLVPATRHLINEAAIARMKRGIIILNTGRGALIDTKALIEGLKSLHVGGAALDVYEEEEKLFFRDLSNEVLADDVLARLLTFPNVLITAHQAFLTREALGAIARTTLASATAFERDEPLEHEVRAAEVLRPSPAAR
jgi:D-lactate dehydrogenase